MKIAVIGGGNMGGAIIRGLANSGRFADDVLILSDLNECHIAQLTAEIPRLRGTYNNIEACEEADLIILCVKPWSIRDVVTQISSHLDYNRQTIVSIAAGVSCQELAEMFETEGQTPSIYRVIPNTAIAVNQSMSFVATQNGSRASTEKVVSIFEQMGHVSLIDEKLMSAATSLGSCGIAFAFRYIRASMEAGVEMGLTPDNAKQIVLQTLRGAVELLEQSGAHPEAEIDKVTTPGGLTIRGVNELEHGGFSSAIINGYKATR